MTSAMIRSYREIKYSIEWRTNESIFHRLSEISYVKLRIIKHLDVKLSEEYWSSLKFQTGTFS